MQQYAGIYLLQVYSTCFGRPSRPSSGVQMDVINTVYGLEDPVLESRHRHKFFAPPNRRDRLWGPPSPLFDSYWFPPPPGSKAAEV